MNSSVKNIIVSAGAVVLALIVGAIIMLIGGYEPIRGYLVLYEAMFQNIYNFGEIIRNAAPLIFAGLAVAFAFRTGLFNIGVEGQFIVGAMTSVFIGTAFKLPLVIHLPLAMLGAALAGGLWAFIPGVLKATLRVHEVVVTIMMNFIALFTSNYLIRSFTEDGNRTQNISPSASLNSGWLTKITENSTIHTGIIFSIIAVVVIWFFIERTTKGYELRTVGFNKDAAQYAGIKVNRNIVYSMVISGALAGLAGAMEGLGGFGYISIAGGFSGVGFDGISVALLGSNNPFGILFSSFLFATLKVGGSSYAFTKVAPQEIVEIIIATIIFFMAINYVIRYFLDKSPRRRVK